MSPLRLNIRLHILLLKKLILNSNNNKNDYLGYVFHMLWHLVPDEDVWDCNVSKWHARLERDECCLFSTCELKQTTERKRHGMPSQIVPQCSLWQCGTKDPQNEVNPFRCQFSHPTMQYSGPGKTECWQLRTQFEMEVAGGGVCT